VDRIGDQLVCAARESRKQKAESRKPMKLNWTLWLKGLTAAVVGGFANSFLSALGITGAQIVGIHVQQLDLRQLITTTVVGGAVGLMLYLKQSPVPPDEK
jgi:branched-subunit amino acid ABC-type transport system permease component